MRPGPLKGGYQHIVFSRNGVVTDRLVHVLVAEAFIGPKPQRHDVNHMDGNKQNNRPENLEYCTRGDNHRHAYRTGLRVYQLQPRRAGGQFTKCAN